MLYVISINFILVGEFIVRVSAFSYKISLTIGT
jgi:hypothetical protein